MRFLCLHGMGTNSRVGGAHLFRSWLPELIALMVYH